MDNKVIITCTGQGVINCRVIHHLVADKMTFFFNCSAVMGIGYGFLIDNVTFIQINSISIAFNIFYIGSFIYCSKSKVSTNVCCFLPQLNVTQTAAATVWTVHKTNCFCHDTVTTWSRVCCLILHFWHFERVCYAIITNDNLLHCISFQTTHGCQN